MHACMKWVSVHGSQYMAYSALNVFDDFPPKFRIRIAATPFASSSSALHRTGSHHDLRSTSPPSKYSVLNGRASSASKNNASTTAMSTLSLPRSKRLTSSNSTINSTASSEAVSGQSSRVSDYTERSLSNDLTQRLLVSENNGSNGESSDRSLTSTSIGGSLPQDETMMKRGLIGLKNLGNTVSFYTCPF